MMFAEHLMLRRWYFLDDDIESFHEYDSRLGHREIRRSFDKHSTFKALNFMVTVLEHSLTNEDNPKEIDDQKEIYHQMVKKWIKCLSEHNRENEAFGKLADILYDRKLLESKNSVLHLINGVLKDYSDNSALIEIKRYLLNDKSKVIGQIALTNMSSYHENYQNRLQGEKPNT